VKLPEKCPACGIHYNVVVGVHMAYLIIRTEPDFDSDDKSRIEDQIFECSNCHQLFRARWKLVSFRQLVEKEIER